MNHWRDAIRLLVSLVARGRGAKRRVRFANLSAVQRALYPADVLARILEMLANLGGRNLMPAVP